MADETQMLRTTQANLITLQSVRISRLEGQLEQAKKLIADLQAENQKLVKQHPTTVDASKPKVDC